MTPKTATDSPDFTERIVTLRKVAYPERTAIGGHPGVQRSLEALQAAHTTAIEALRVAIEELHRQHTELVSTRQALETERQCYQELFDLVPDGYLVTDAYGTIHEANRAAALLLNVSPQALIGKSLLAFAIQKEQRTFPTWLSQRLQAGQAQEWELRLQPHDRKPFDAGLTLSALALDAEDGTARVVHMRWLLRDITRRKRAEARARQAAELARVNTELRQFMSIVSHDLHGPLRTMAQLLHLVADRSHGALDAEAAEALAFVVDEAQHLQHMLTDLLSLYAGGWPNGHADPRGL